MTDLLARLSPALADRYRIERELGQGFSHPAHDLVRGSARFASVVRAFGLEAQVATTPAETRLP